MTVAGSDSSRTVRYAGYTYVFVDFMLQAYDFREIFKYFKKLVVVLDYGQ